MKKRIIIGILLIIIIVLFVYKFIFKDKETVKALPIVEEIEETKKTVTNLKVDIKGAINNPGVYELENNKRVIDAINIAGGLREDADTKYLNLSLKLTDEMVIIIYTKDEINEQEKNATVVKYVEKECNCPLVKNDACLYKSNNSSPDNQVSGKININNATLDELQTLSGIGESKAQAIIDYRNENGHFNNIEDIKNVSGIGDSAYNKIKDSITV